MQRAAVLLVAWVLGAATAQAAQRDAREAEARKRCLSGDVQGGVALLAELYVDTQNATYIYNQARCFQQNGRADEAIQRFREYLRKARDATADERRQVEAYIKELELDRDARARAAVAPPGESVRVPAPSLPPLPPERAEPGPRPILAAEPAAELRAEPREAGMSPLGIAGIAAAATGAALIGGGVYFGLRAHSLERSVEERAQKELIVDRAEQRRGERAVTYQWIGYGAGATALLGGALIYFISIPRAGHERALALSPLVSAGGLGAALHGGF